MTAKNQFAMVLIEDHMRDVSREHILDDSNRLAGPCIPNLDILLASYEDFKSFLAKLGAADCLVVGEIGDERPRVLEDGEVTSSTDQASMLRHGSDTLNFANVVNVESLDAAVVQNAPHLDHSFGVSSDEAVQVREAIDADQTVLVAVQRHDRARQVGVPYEDVQVEATTNYDFVLLGVSHLSDCPLVALESLNGCDGQVAEDLFVHRVVLEVGLDLGLHPLLFSLFLGVDLCARGSSKRILIALDLFLAKVPKVNLSVVVTSGQLVNIWQVLEALDEVVNEPGGVLGSVGDVFLTLLVPCHLLLLAPTWTLHRGGVLTGCIFRVTWLWLVVEREEKLDVPSKYGALGTTGEQELLLLSFDVG